ncbi:unnamed protein product [Staurois parvus]|uniref:Uncharacterized protein n=1 Tax=Staurois parvus TaxID=386267 RepID=A0ABN9H012_9NEOB|nr:unnamed protein product [Staurois parvus]
MEASGGDWQRGVEDTEWRPVEGLAEGGGGHRMEVSRGIGRGGWRTLSRWKANEEGVAIVEVGEFRVQDYTHHPGIRGGAGCH